ncbi:MAG TPA: Holliday junction resolvase RuvX [Hypericibacter adhaerens]|jgi:putative Holliday junction resolvase|uniref:Putative pre-16S rRNA nuclease n=1 Tax=Hypericibacter adhaerens TaxID=2602016 RepID=A0A5J6MZA7_9PROT|nr:Holliday junction resolvase RuvX [Hypericibacter adhaerens]QEX23098.1 putative pre-16S rRNA nuclease [Hypericibacter adhaerens]HWA45489.1 Holliday junction resolvase RuvX [Hypericibacter adhaerens]
MPLLAADALRQALPPRGALMGLDVGTKTIGMALSDPDRRVASPLDTIRRTKFGEDAARLEALIDERRVAGLVIGLPVALDGSEGPRCQSVRQFAANLMARRDLPTLLWDERFSTAAIERFLVDEADMSRKRRSEVVDKMAAAYILQGALDALNRAP